MTHWKLHINRLLQLELQYEVASRRFSAELLVMELRKSLRNILKRECDSSFCTVEHDFLSAIDIEAITAGANFLWFAIEEFNGDVSTNTFQRITTFFAIFSVEKMKVTNNEEKAQQRLWLLTLANLRFECDAKVKLFRRFFPIVSPIMAMTVSSPAPPTTDADDFLYGSDSETEISPTTVAVFPSRYVPVDKWSLKFLRDAIMSVNAFLEQVDELCRSCRVDSVLDLLVGRAFVNEYVPPARRKGTTLLEPDLVCFDTFTATPTIEFLEILLIIRYALRNHSNSKIRKHNLHSLCRFVEDYYTAIQNHWCI
ncbi:hypothetical protein FQA39_LY05243 [Lamprigera yunnana]|nr:hypothetical protein FQA39_LY05243 [Lamprigera yunnana]